MLPRVVAALFALALLATPALAQDTSIVIPEGAHVAAAGNATLSFWVGATPGTMDESVAEGENASLWLAIARPNATHPLVAFLNVTFAAPNPSLPASPIVLGRDPFADNIGSVALPNVTREAADLNVTYAISGEVYEDDNGTLVLLSSVNAEGVYVLEAEAPAPPPAGPAIPRTWLLAGLALLVLGGGAGAVAMRRRAIRRRMNEGPRRSQVMREMELEQKLERAKAKDPEAAVVIQKEIRQAEQVREKRRELQILEAKRADVLKTLDLLKKRQEAGGLTKHQYDNMAAKKQQDLARIDAEIAEMERQDAGSAA